MEKIDADLAAEGEARVAAAATVPADLLARYERLRTRIGGTGAARLVGGSCSGCHLALPAMEVDRIRKAPPDEVITLRPVRSDPGPVTESPCSSWSVTASRRPTPPACCSGRAESPLTENGRSQVASLSALVVGAGRLISSPLGRARETAAALGLGLPIEVDERWTEIDYGELEGTPLSAVPRRGLAPVARRSGLPPPGR